ncbi:MAG: flagellar hook-basal body complex protein FliE [Alphaproteobacteria bacterium]|nr:flagellar hook-basal body complex protein FliE [Alphaproteobacteria bacterium]
MSTPSLAANAYASLARLTDAAGAAKGLTPAAPGSSFGDMLQNAVTSFTETSRKTDVQTHALASGKSNLVDVVTAVAETEVAIDTLVSVRDRVIHAYEEIMRMPI